MNILRTAGLSIIYYLPIFLLSNCTQKVNEKESFVDQFPVSQHISSVPLKKIEHSLPDQIIVVDSLLVVLNSMGNKFFLVFDKSNMELLAEFGTKGEGPGEFFAVDYIRPIIGQNNDENHLILDWRKQRLNFLNLKESIRLNSPVLSSKKLPNDLNDTYRLVNYSDTLIITVPTGRDELGRFKVFKNKKANIIDYLPDLPFEVHKKNRYPIYANVSSAIHPQKNKFVATAGLLGQYDFFDFAGNYLHSTVVHRNDNLQIAAVAPFILDEPIIFYHTQLIGTDSYIYSLYSTRTKEKGISRSEIHVLDWEGKPVKEYLLDCTLLTFDLDFENNVGYGLSYSNDSAEDIHVVKFELGEELR